MQLVQKVQEVQTAALSRREEGILGVVMARTEFGVEIMHTYNGGRWLWNEDQSWLEYIEPGKVMPSMTVILNERQNNFYEAIMQSCKSEEQRVYMVRKVQEEA